MAEVFDAIASALPRPNNPRHIHNRFNPNYSPSVRSVEHHSIPNVDTDMSVLL
jgi:hypothetical protein